MRKKPRKSDATVRQKKTDTAALLRARTPTPSSQPDQPKADNVLPVPRSKDETTGQALARALLRPTVNAAITLKRISCERESVSIGDLVEELVNQCDAVAANQLGRTEGMLIAQAHTLDALFHRLLRRAALNEGEYLQAADRYFRLALRTQSQCRATLESLALIKNPPHLAFVKQANIGQAVQVNNGGGPTDSAARARETKNAPNKLLEHSNDQRVDFGAPSETGEADSSLETVGAVNGTAHRAR